MEDIVNLIATNQSASDVSDAIKDALNRKALERVDEARPVVASLIFGDDDEE